MEESVNLYISFERTWREKGILTEKVETWQLGPQKTMVYSDFGNVQFLLIEKLCSVARLWVDMPPVSLVQTVAAKFLFGYCSIILTSSGGASTVYIP
jgi:hypothetical protein